MLVDTRLTGLSGMSLYASMSMSIFIILSLSWTIEDSGLGGAYFKDEELVLICNRNLCEE